MIDRTAGLAAEIEQLLVAGLVGARIDLVAAIGLQRRRCENLAQDSDAVDDSRAVGLGCQIVDADLRRRARVSAPDCQRAAALRTELADRGGEAREGMQLLAHLVGRERDEVDLDVWCRKAWIGLEEGARGAGRNRQWPAAECGILQAGKGPPHGMIDNVV